MPGCAPGHYRSVFVARNNDAPDLSAYAGKTFAYNEALSQSGWAAPMLHMEHAGILPGQVLPSGGHLFSARAVAEGRADFAALDAVSWALMCRYDRFARNLQAIAVTMPTPGLPMISAKGSDANALFEAVSQAINTLDPQHKNTLMLNGIVRIGARAYLQVTNPQHTPDDLPPAS